MAPSRRVGTVLPTTPRTTAWTHREPRPRRGHASRTIHTHDTATRPSHPGHRRWRHRTHGDRRDRAVDRERGAHRLEARSGPGHRRDASRRCEVPDPDAEEVERHPGPVRARAHAPDRGERGRGRAGPRGGPVPARPRRCAGGLRLQEHRMGRRGRDPRPARDTCCRHPPVRQADPHHRLGALHGRSGVDRARRAIPGADLGRTPDLGRRGRGGRWLGPLPRRGVRVQDPPRRRYAAPGDRHRRPGREHRRGHRPALRASRQCQGSGPARPGRGRPPASPADSGQTTR